MRSHKPNVQTTQCIGHRDIQRRVARAGDNHAGDRFVAAKSKDASFVRGDAVGGTGNSDGCTGNWCACLRVGYNTVHGRLSRQGCRRDQ